MPWDFWLIFLVLGVLIPWRGNARLKRLLSQPAPGTKEKLILYGSTIAFQWILLGLAAWRALARGLTANELGLARRVGVEIFVASVFGAALLSAFQWFNLRRLGRTSGPVVDMMRKLAERLLPTQGKLVEFLPYCVLAVTAGVCEEFLYRGFSMAALGRVGMPAWAIVVLTSGLFGLAHAYQGRGGIVGTALLGVLFAASRLIFSSLVPVIVWHTAVDVTAGLAGPRFLPEGKEPAPVEMAA
jgi:membrane protease YdiL (CAAX protease family)